MALVADELGRVGGEPAPFSGRVRDDKRTGRVRRRINPVWATRIIAPLSVVGPAGR